MPRPAGIEFVDRLAPHKNGFIFLCQRSGHKPKQAFVRGAQRDAEQVRAAHDAIYHNALLQGAGVAADVGIHIDDLVDAYNARNEQLAAKNRLSPKTVRYYRYVGAALKKVFRPREPLHNMKPHRISKAAIDLQDVLEESAGAAIAKALGALKVMLTWKGVSANWKVPIDEIDPESIEKRELTMEQILWLIENTPPGSLEEAVIALKMRTGMREVELAALNVADFDTDDRLIEVTLRSKGRRRKKVRRQIYPLANDIVAMLIPFTIGRVAADPLLPIGGERMKESSLRRRLVTASKAANTKLQELLERGEIDQAEYERKLIDPPVRGLKPVRAEVATVVEEETDEKEAAAWIGHRNPETLRKHYLKERRVRAKVEEKRKIAEVLRRVAPLPVRSAAEHGVTLDAEHDPTHGQVH